MADIIGKNILLTTTCVDHVLEKFDNYYEVIAPTSDLSINLRGTKHEKPSVDGSTHIANIKTWCSNAGFVARIDVN